MALVTDAVDVDAVGLDELDDADGTGGLVAVVFNVVVIVLKLLVFVWFIRMQGDLQKRRASGAYFFANLKAIGMKASPMVSYHTLER
jgi:hypothetical protein